MSRCRDPRQKRVLPKFPSEGPPDGLSTGQMLSNSCLYCKFCSCIFGVARCHFCATTDSLPSPDSMRAVVRAMRCALLTRGWEQARHTPRFDPLTGDEDRSPLQGLVGTPPGRRRCWRRVEQCHAPRRTRQILAESTPARSRPTALGDRGAVPPARSVPLRRRLAGAVAPVRLHQTDPGSDACGVPTGSLRRTSGT